jgi:ribosomal protein S18 acetylase RimI-like enzyme
MQVTRLCRSCGSNRRHACRVQFLQRVALRTVIRLALPGDLPHLAEIEVAAGEMFRTFGMESVAEHAPSAPEELATYQRRARAWVTSPSRAATPVGFVLVDVVDGYAHIDQLSVHPSAAGQRLGQALIDTVSAWAVRHGMAAVTLTTFAHVPWNAPYYRRLGFVDMADDEHGPGLLAVREHEAARGLTRWPRVAMKRLVTGRTH